jgi:hypothetical protein
VIETEPHNHFVETLCTIGIVEENKKLGFIDNRSRINKSDLKCVRIAVGAHDGGTKS